MSSVGSLNTLRGAIDLTKERGVPYGPDGLPNTPVWFVGTSAIPVPDTAATGTPTLNTALNYPRYIGHRYTWAEHDLGQFRLHTVVLG